MDKDRDAFVHGRHDYRVYAVQRRFGLVPREGYPARWQPVEGHEDAYWPGWETAKRELAREQEMREAA